jgi:hypothetical protein
MTDAPPQTEFTEDRVPVEGIEETVEELVELYGGDMKSSAQRERRFILPLRRGVATGGGVECTLTWSSDDEGQATVRLVCDRQVDAPKAQRVALLAAGVIGSILFMLWPFFPPHERGMGTLAWVGAAIAIAVYFLTLRRSSGGLALDFLQRLARRQRAATETADVTDDR